MRKVGIMQPYLFPYIGYFQLLNAVDEYVIYDDVNFIKGGWINRNNLLIGGRKTLFTISLAGASPNKLINEVEIQGDFSKFLRTVSMAYSKAPYSDQVIELLNRICGYQDRNLAMFIGNSIKEISNHLDITTHINYSSSLNKTPELKGQDKVLAICEELNADMYINAIGGRELYDEYSFEEHGIMLKFLKTNFTEYEQLSKSFVPGLSIIDAMMFNSPQELRRMLGNYELT